MIRRSDDQMIRKWNAFAAQLLGLRVGSGGRVGDLARPPLSILLGPGVAGAAPPCSCVSDRSGKPAGRALAAEALQRRARPERVSPKEHTTTARQPTTRGASSLHVACSCVCSVVTALCAACCTSLDAAGGCGGNCCEWSRTGPAICGILCAGYDPCHGRRPDHRRFYCCDLGSGSRYRYLGIPGTVPGRAKEQFAWLHTE
jgi:hypothetical protein